MSDNAAELLEALRAILPVGSACAWADPQRVHPLAPGEGLSRAVPARLREFSAGRAAARQAMTLLALPAQGIPHGPDRAPIWPQGMAGSISHSRSDCLAVVWPGGRGIGLDLEPDALLPQDLWPIVLRPAERAAMTAADDPAAKMIFTVKEAAYKAQYPLSKKLFDFQGMEVTCEGSRFSARFCLEARPFGRGDQIKGHILRVKQHFLALAVLE